MWVADTVAAPSVTVSLKRTAPGVAGASNVGVNVVGVVEGDVQRVLDRQRVRQLPSTCVHWYVSVCGGVAVVCGSVAVPGEGHAVVPCVTNGGPVAATIGAVLAAGSG